VQRVREQIEHVLLQVRLEVDEQVATDDEIDAREGNAAADVLLAEDDHLPQRLRDLEPRFDRLEEARPVIVGERVEKVRGVETAARERDGTLVEVGREDAHVPLVELVAEHVGDEQRERVGLFARRAPRGPEAQRSPVIASARDERREDVLLDVLERERVAEELGDLDDEGHHELAHLVGVRLEQLAILLDGVAVRDRHAPRDATKDRRALVR
jgi:hypothetical protein